MGPTSDTMDPKEIQEIFEDKSLPEAPLSINIGSYYRGFYVGWTRRSANGSTKGLPEEVKTFIEGLVTVGYKPSWNEQTNKDQLFTPPAKPINAVVPVVAQSNTPAVDLSIAGTDGKGGMCSIHTSTPKEWKSGIAGAKAKNPGKPYGFWACPLTDANGNFCKG